MNISKLLVDSPSARAEASKPDEELLESVNAAIGSTTFSGLIHFCENRPTRNSSEGDVWFKCSDEPTVIHWYTSGEWVCE